MKKKEKRKKKKQRTSTADTFVKVTSWTFSVCVCREREKEFNITNMLKDGYNFNPLTGTPCNEVQVTSLSIPAQKCCAA